MILGHTWCYLTNCQIDWHKIQAKMVYKGNAVQVPLLQEDTSTQPTMPTSGDSTSDKGKGKQVLTPNTSPLKPSPSPQSKPTTSTTQPHQEITPCSHNTTSMVTRWVPKKLLFKGTSKARQMYGYHGNLTIKSQHLPRNQNPDSPRLREHNAKEGRINDGCQYHYWRAMVSTKATIKYGYPSK